MNDPRAVTAHADVDGGMPPARRRHVARLRALGLLLTLVLAFLVLAVIGAHTARRGARVLAVLDPVVAWTGGSGGALARLAFDHRVAVGWVSSVAAAAVALLGVVINGWRSAPLLLLAAAVSLAVWGQVAVLSDRAIAGLCLYGAGFVCAIGLGWWYPLTRLPGFPRWPVPGERRAANERRAWPAAEIGLVFGLTLVALLSRLYALNELPNAFDAETIVSVLASHSFAGLRQYLPWGLLGTSTGLAHLLPQMALFRLFGTSVYTLRLTALLYGVAAVPLCYWLARRIAGTGPAVVTAVLLIAAPEQLFWSRSEFTSIAPVAVAALVAAHLGLWLTERLSPLAVLAAALWMPICRLFYVPAMILFAYPLVLYAHAVVCVRGAWRSAWYAAPLLASGLTLWVFTLTIANAAVNNWQWRFVNPAGSYAAAAWTQDGQLQGAGMAETLRRRIRSVSENVQRVATAMASYTGFTHVYVRIDESSHPTLVNVGLLVMVMLGLGYLLGQASERRAFALLLWVALGLLPPLLSDDPVDRRMAVVFPALYIVVGVFVGAMVRLGRRCGGRLLARLSSAVLTAAVFAVVWTSLASHFRLPITPVAAERAFRFTEPLFQESDVILHGLDWNTSLLMVFGNFDEFLTRQPCYHPVPPGGWLMAALRLPCEFKDPVYRLMLPPQHIERLRAAEPRRGRFSFLLDDQPATRPQVGLLRALYPGAAYHELRGPDQDVQLTSLTIDVADAQALHRPALQTAPGEPAAAGLASHVLAGVSLAVSPPPAPNGLVVSGGLLIERPDWYRFALDPGCEPASFTVDAQSAAALRPLLAGVHSFELTLPDAAACALPVHLLMQSHAQHEFAPIPPEAIVSPAVAALSAAQAPALGIYDGYGVARRFAEPAGRIVDFGVDRQGRVFVLVQEPDGYRIRRFGPDGSEEHSWQPQGPEGHAVSAIAVAPDGDVLLRAEHTAWWFDRDGQRVSTWDPSALATPDIAILDDGRSLTRLPDINAIAILDRDGRVQARWDEFTGGPGRFRFPASVTRNQDGDLLIIENDGQALLFHNPPGRFEPQFVHSFPLAFTGNPVQPAGVAFDADARILAPDAEARTTLVYDLDGRRLMAEQPERDLNTRGFGNVIRYAATAAGVYVLDEAHRLWIMTR